jgi:hypothetical protein
VVVDKPASWDGMPKYTLARSQIQIIIIHFLSYSFPLIPNG